MQDGKETPPGGSGYYKPEGESPPTRAGQNVKRRRRDFPTEATRHPCALIGQARSGLRGQTWHQPEPLLTAHICIHSARNAALSPLLTEAKEGIWLPSPDVEAAVMVLIIPTTRFY